MMMIKETWNGILWKGMAKGDETHEYMWIEVFDDFFATTTKKALLWIQTCKNSAEIRANNQFLVANLYLSRIEISFEKEKYYFIMTFVHFFVYKCIKRG